MNDNESKPQFSDVFRVELDAAMPKDCFIVKDDNGAEVRLKDGRHGEGYCAKHDQIAVKLENGSWRHG